MGENRSNYCRGKIRVPLVNSPFRNLSQQSLENTLGVKLVPSVAEIVQTFHLGLKASQPIRLEVVLAQILGRRGAVYWQAPPEYQI